MPEEREGYVEAREGEAAPRIVAGDQVKFNVETLANRFPRADDTVNANSPMVAAAVDKETDMVTCTRQGVPYGIFSAGELIKVEADPPPPPPPAASNELPPEPSADNPNV